MTRLALLSVLVLLVLAAPAAATPVCTDGFMGGPPASLCGGRIFPEAADAKSYVQFTADPLGFVEYQHGIQYLAKKYPRWVSVFKLSDRYGPNAVSAGPDGIRAGEPGDQGDGRPIQVIEVTDHDVPDAGKQTLLFSLSVHGNERGGLEGGLRTAEDLAMAASSGGKLRDGVGNYDSSTGRKALFHEPEVKDVLKQEAVYFVDFNADGWAVGDFWNPPAPAPYSRGNSIGTDLNRQQPTIGRIDPGRNPLQENEMASGTQFMRDVAKAGQGGRMAYGADIHGELTSQAYMDIMYPAGEFDSMQHRRLMSIAERTKSVIDATLYQGIIDQTEHATGDDAEYPHAIPVKPAHWATVWDTLGYTDTGFIGDYLATDLGVTGMDYEIFFNHTIPEKTWDVYLQENHINASRGIIKTAMAYALFQKDEFNASNVAVDPGGRAGFLVNPDTVTNTDENGAGVAAGPKHDGVGEDGKPVTQQPYEVSNMKWFLDEDRYMPRPFFGLTADQIAADPAALDQVDSLVVADTALPSATVAGIKAWVQRGGNLVLTDSALGALAPLGLVKPEDVSKIQVYLPFANFTTFDHPLSRGLRSNARQLVESAVIGYGIQGIDEKADSAPMTVVATSAWKAAGGTTVGTTPTVGTGEDPAVDKTLDDGSLTSIGEVALGKGKVRIVGGALLTPTEDNDHRFGLRDYGLTYSGTFLMENAIRSDAPDLGTLRKGANPYGATNDLPAAIRDDRLRCRGRRVFRVVARSKRPFRRVRVTVNGKRVRPVVRRRGERNVIRVRVRGAARVKVTARTLRGRRVTKTRRTC